MFEMPQADPVIAERDDERMLRLQCLGYANAMNQRFATDTGATMVDTAEALIDRAKTIYDWVTEGDPEQTVAEVAIGGTD